MKCYFCDSSLSDSYCYIMYAQNTIPDSANNTRIANICSDCFWQNADNLLIKSFKTFKINTGCVYCNLGVSDTINHYQIIHINGTERRLALVHHTCYREHININSAKEMDPWDVERDLEILKSEFISIEKKK